MYSLHISVACTCYFKVSQTHSSSSPRQKFKIKDFLNKNPYLTILWCHMKVYVTSSIFQLCRFYRHMGKVKFPWLLLYNLIISGWKIIRWKLNHKITSCPASVYPILGQKNPCMARTVLKDKFMPITDGMSKSPQCVTYK